MSEKIQTLIDAAKALREETYTLEKVQVSGLDSILIRSKGSISTHIELKESNEPELFKRIAEALMPTVAQKKELCRENDKKLAEVEKLLA